ncbi:uncharacterized protein with HEPN domain [Arcanobacterium wilhelmae]|uniref:Uncharacterized protein with HEPN domain n=1 Tax=Arcanobacterium wilhelmae TaxID=1803177 RepID=A0ABT9NB61_9ACTO|nr:HepT-like ribonuclease domain-containing protein [Arcanobacterium wilhelmae]MDP9800938.1 uncharacterized protein with HEPN domain [Arcanobacterium wilhelmae]WFN90298.1 DUF86 domain-containing protein [Arcanobacterium wilhelmae]
MSDDDGKFSFGFAPGSGRSTESEAYFARHGFRRSSVPFDLHVALRRLSEMLDGLEVARAIVHAGGDSFFIDNMDGEKTRYAAYYAITRVVEASQRLHSDVKEAHPEVPWSIIRQMRNKIVHFYDEIDDQVVWETLASDFPDLELAVRQIRAKLESEL